MVLTYQSVQQWAVMMRVDMLAIAFSMAGVYLTIVAGQKTMTLCAAVLLFVLAVYRKQTELAAPMAAVLVAAAVDVRSALKASAFGLLIGGAAFFILQLVTDGGFSRRMLGYNLHNRFFFHRIIDQILYQKPDALGLLTGVIAFTFLWWTEATQNIARSLGAWADAIRKSTRLRALTIVSLWFSSLLCSWSHLAKGFCFQLLGRMGVHNDRADRYGREYRLDQSGDCRQIGRVCRACRTFLVASRGRTCASSTTI
jgi:hypothetical protein